MHTLSSRSRSLLVLVTWSLALAACSDDPTTPNPPPPAPQRYIVVFNDNVENATILAPQLANTHGGTLHHVYQHAIKGFAATLSVSAADALGRTPGVAYVERDLVVSAQTTQLGATWGLDRVDQRYRPLNGTYTYTRTGRGVNVYVIDTGIETSHAEFGGRARVGIDVAGGDGQDCTGHGTHAAGTIGGNTYGIAREVSLISVRVFGCSDTTRTSTVIAGVDWVRFTHQKPAVANFSLRSSVSLALDQAVRGLIAAGVTSVTAAGNDLGDACHYSPARVVEALTVGASGPSDAKSPFSNHGVCVDVYAPGSQIGSAWLQGAASTRDGTSAAAAHVTGVVALHLQGEPGASPPAMGTLVLSEATPGLLSGLGAGSPNRLLHTRFGTPAGGRTALHRLFSQEYGDHLYGQDPDEGRLMGYVLEARDYFYVASEPEIDHVPLYRCYRPDIHDHFLSMTAACEGAENQGMQGHMATLQLSGTVPLYRLRRWGTGNTFYTMSAEEAESAIFLYAYVHQGVAGYVYPGE
jgi:subtilisin family serine protease